MAAQTFGPLTHPYQPEIAVSRRKYIVWFEATSVVQNSKAQLVRVDFQLHSNLIRIGMVDGVCDCLLCDAENVVSNFLRDAAGLSIYFDFNVNP